jgi:hypothetical protein
VAEKAENPNSSPVYDFVMWCLYLLFHRGKTRQNEAKGTLRDTELLFTDVFTDGETGMKLGRF